VQKIWSFFNREMAKVIPTVMVAGKAGGTATVIRSSDWSTKTSVYVPKATSLGTVAQKPMIATKAMIKTQINESR